MLHIKIHRGASCFGQCKDFSPVIYIFSDVSKPMTHEWPGCQHPTLPCLSSLLWSLSLRTDRKQHVQNFRTDRLPFVRFTRVALASILICRDQNLICRNSILIGYRALIALLTKFQCMKWLLFPGVVGLGQNTLFVPAPGADGSCECPCSQVE